MVRLTVHVTPRAGRDSIDGVVDGMVRARVTAAPANGAANDATTRLLARALGVPPSRLRLVAGASARVKTFDVAGMDADELRAALAAIATPD